MIDLFFVCRTTPLVKCNPVVASSASVPLAFLSALATYASHSESR